MHVRDANGLEARDTPGQGHAVPYAYSIIEVRQARMAKLADAADLKSAGRKAVGVQVPLWAPI